MEKQKANSSTCQDQGVTKTLEQYENDVNHMQWPSHSPHLNLLYRYEILDMLDSDLNLN